MSGKSVETKALTVETMKISDYLTNNLIQNKINEMLGGEDGKKFITGLVSAVSTNPKLQECTNSSIFMGALLGAGLKLSPSPQLGQYYLVPFNDKVKGKVAQFMLGYKGYIQLAIRSGQYKDIDVIEIREGEFKGRNKNTGKYEFEFIEDDEYRETLEIVGYMAHFEYLNGFTKTLYWSKEKVLKHADVYSPAFTSKGKELLDSGNVKKDDEWKYSSFWYKSFDDMAKKTMLRQLISKWGIMSIDLQTAIENDMAVITESGREYLAKETGADKLIINQSDNIPEAIVEDTKESEEVGFDDI